MKINSKNELLAVCSALLGEKASVTAGERRLLLTAVPARITSTEKASLKSALKKGADPLGEAFSAIRSAGERRALGAVYTPAQIVRSMLRWLGEQGGADRFVDPGAGSGRYILQCGLLFPKASLVAIELDPLACLMLRANAWVLGLQDRLKIIVGDYRNVKLSKIRGVTAFVGNPPYVRHHDIEENWKNWYVEEFANLGIRASALAGLHLHFFLKTRLLAKTGDIGAFITSAEWMDVNYGAALRNLLVDELGGLALHVLEPTVEAFPGTQTTAAITCFRVGEVIAPMQVRAVDELPLLNGLTNGTDVERTVLSEAHKWSIIVRPTPKIPDAEMELGEMFRVHRGQVTGANGIWIAGEHADLLPESVLVPTVTRARELIAAGARLRHSDALRRIVDLPVDLSVFSDEERHRVEKFLRWAKNEGGDQSFIARHRKAWWSVGLRDPAPILVTYMARRPPQFTLNECAARHINVVHGLYPRENFAPEVLRKVVIWLNGNISVAAGRTYAGGLTKFEPKEIERLHIPSLDTFTA
jgi:hypothetical protein